MINKHKKGIIWGGIFGALIVPFATLGLALRVVEVIAVPFTMLTRYLVNILVDTSTSSGGLTMFIGFLISIVVYAVFGFILSLINQKLGKVVVVAVIVLYYLGFTFFGISTVVVSPNGNNPIIQLDPNNRIPTENFEE